MRAKQNFHYYACTMQEWFKSANPAAAVNGVYRKSKWRGTLEHGSICWIYYVPLPLKTPYRLTNDIPLVAGTKRIGHIYLRPCSGAEDDKVFGQLVWPEPT